MALITISQPVNLLGRRVRGSYRSSPDGPVWDFDGVVECVVLPAPGFEEKHGVCFFVADSEFVDIRDCIEIDYSPALA